MNHIRHLLFLVLFSIFIPGIWGQSNEVIDALMESDNAAFGEAVYLALSAADVISDMVDTEHAVNVLYQKGWKLKERDVGDTISLGEYSYILMKAFDMKGGLFYSLFPAPRYAARELKYLGFIRGYSSPYRKLGGHEAIKMLGKLMRWREVSE